MKKLSILTIIAAMAMVSCGNSYDAKRVSLINQNDSINYALGYLNGAQIKMQQLGDVEPAEAKKACAEFMDALDAAYNGKQDKQAELSEIEQIGENIGQSIKQSEKQGLAGNPAWTLNEKLFFQGLINALHHDTTFAIDAAREFFQAQYMASRGSEETAGKPVTGDCPSKPKSVKLVTLNDSLNYAFGVLNGSELIAYFIGDSTGADRKAFIKAVNRAMDSKVAYPQLVNIAKQIGSTIKEQEPQGLLQIPELATDFTLIKQGFVNGFLATEADSLIYWNPYEASQYIGAAINDIKYGSAKQEGAEWLEQNKMREGVQVTESGLQYEVIKMGKGAMPTATDRVKVHYTGTLIDGTKFDSSYDRNEPTVFGVGQVIKGWTEGLQLMPVGSKFKFFIPYDLAYGERGAGAQIPPFATLIFEVELLGIEK